MQPKLRTREKLPETKAAGLTVSQAADVLLWLNAADNAESRRNGWSDKTCLGLTAIHATKTLNYPQGMLDDGQAFLTRREASDALHFLGEPSDPIAEMEDWREVQAKDLR